MTVHAFDQTSNGQSSSAFRIGTHVTNALNGSFLFHLFDEAVADLFCLRTYTHGTSPSSYIQILKKGADPTLGGQGGESAFYKAFGYEHDVVEPHVQDNGWNSKGRFYVFLHECPWPIKQWQPRVYSVVTCIGENCSQKQNKLIRALLVVVSIFEGFCAPVLKFRFSDERITFEQDKSFSDTTPIAGFTQQSIAPDHIGLLGSFREGVKPRWRERIKNHPTQFAKGILKLIVLVSVVAFIVFTAIRYPLASKILLICGVVRGVQILGRFFIPLCLAEKRSNQSSV